MRLLGDQAAERDALVAELLQALPTRVRIGLGAPALRHPDGLERAAALAVPAQELLRRTRA